MKIGLKFILLFCLQFILPEANAQETNQYDDLDKKYTPNENSIFNSLRKKNTSSNTSSAPVEFNNVIYYTPTLLFRKKIFFSYERKLSDYFSAAAGIGKAYAPDLLQQLGKSYSLFDNSLFETSLSAKTIYDNSTYTSSSPFLQFNLKYYTEKVFEETFIEVIYRNESMHYTLNNSINLSPSTPSREVIFKMQSLTFGYGHCWLAGKNKKMVNCIYFNAGIKYFKFPRFNAASGSSYFSAPGVYERSETEFKTLVHPTINLGYSFGIGF